MTIQLGADVFYVTVGIYALSAILYLVYLSTKQKAVADAARGVLVAGFLMNTAALVIRGMALGRVPFLNMYEYMISCIWGATAVYLGLEIITRNRFFGAFAVPFITFAAFMASRLPFQMVDIMPALRSAWRVPHITSAILAYGAFAVAFMMAIMYLLAVKAEGNKESFWASRLPSSKFIDQAIYRVVAFGFLMQTILILVGAVWAQVSWGRYWGWDPKETWSFITWLIYATYLHTRTMMGWRGQNSVLMALFGFIAVIFTLFGVNWLGGLHAYSSIK
ncbi:MAG: c-type cytochrome biogenesis protein CcsB [Armatimonadota bacterium]